jgi:hypothetical protein
MCWGYDFYNIESIKKSYLSKESLRFEQTNRNINWYIGNIIRKFTPNILAIISKQNKKGLSEKQYINLLKKISSISTVVPNEVSFIQKIINHNLPYIPLKYGDLSSLIKTYKDQTCNDEGFFIGNSATTTSNHIEALKLIKKKVPNPTNIYIPISYGDIKYGNYLKEAAKEVVKTNLIFLEEFIDIRSYNEILLRCGNVIMNHYRQQAMGNIILAIHNGARVFLNKKNPIYSFLKSSGMIIFDIQTDLDKIDTLPTFTELAKHNRPILENIYSRDKVLEETRHFIEHFEKRG